jgi:hypothetical protein
MRMTTLSDVAAETSFVEAAAKCFREDPSLTSFTHGSIEPGALLALRWGLGNDCVLVLKLDETHKPVIYGQAI